MAKELNSVNQDSFLALLQIQCNKCKDSFGWNWHWTLFWIINISDTTSIIVSMYVYFNDKDCCTGDQKNEVKKKSILITSTYIFWNYNWNDYSTIDNYCSTCYFRRLRKIHINIIVRYLTSMLNNSLYFCIKDQHSLILWLNSKSF